MGLDTFVPAFIERNHRILIEQVSTHPGKHQHLLVADRVGKADIPSETRKAQMLRNEMSLQEAAHLNT